MTEIELLVDLHKNHERQGPGGRKELEKALDLANLNNSNCLKIADIGCGTGVSSLALAEILNCKITAIDFLSDFINILTSTAKKRGQLEKISPIVCSMDNLSFEKEELDLIWSEGAIYNMGFENGLKYWKQFLKPFGTICVSEITWLTDKRPQEINNYWNEAYPEIGTAGDKLRTIERCGYSPIGYFVLPEECWENHYYKPIERDFDSFLDRHQGNHMAKELVNCEIQEIKLYRKYKEFFSYGFYIAEKVSENPS